MFRRQLVLADQLQLYVGKLLRLLRGGRCTNRVIIINKHDKKRKKLVLIITLLNIRSSRPEVQTLLSSHLQSAIDNYYVTKAVRAWRIFMHSIWSSIWYIYLSNYYIFHVPATWLRDLAMDWKPKEQAIGPWTCIFCFWWTRNLAFHQSDFPAILHIGASTALSHFCSASEWIINYPIARSPVPGKCYLGYICNPLGLSQISLAWHI